MFEYFNNLVFKIHNSLFSKRGRANIINIYLGWFLCAYLLNTENHSTESLSKKVRVNTKAKVNERNKKISRDNIREMQKECNCIIKEIYLVDRIFCIKCTVYMIYQMQRCKLLLLGISRDNLFNKDLLLRNLLIYKLIKHRWNFAAGKKKIKIIWCIGQSRTTIATFILKLGGEVCI